MANKQMIFEAEIKGLEMCMKAFFNLRLEVICRSKNKFCKEYCM